MKIALFFSYGVGLSTWERRGLFDREVALYRAYVQRGHEIYFITYENDEVFSNRLPEGIKILSNKYNIPKGLYSLIAPFIYRIELRLCDVYKTNQILGSWTALLAGCLFQKPVVIRTGYTPSIYYTTTKRYKKKIISHFLEWINLFFSDVYIVSSNSEREYLGKKSRIVVIPNYVDTDLFLPKFKQKNESFEILFIGRLEKEKNISNLIKALEGYSSIHLIVIGNGSLRSSLERLSQTLGVDSLFLGNIPYGELPKYYQQTDLFVLPSLFEGTPKVLLEAMSCGLPVLVSDIEAMTQIVTNGQDGIVVGPDVESIRNAVNRLIADTILRDVIGINARQTIIKHFGIDRYVHQEEHVLMSVTKIANNS